MVVQQFIYDPWGKQYNVHSNGIFSAYSSPGISKGYTGHKMVNDMDIIHMNGRTYNVVLGRFMQADPHIQAPTHLQNYNRYAYVLNNPMSMTDPSGYFFTKLGKKLFRGLIKTSVKIFGAELTNFAGSVFFSWAGLAPGAGYWSYNFTRAMGGTSSGALKGAITATASAIAFNTVGAQTAAGSFENMLGNAVVGGIMSDLQGGKFGHGFWAAGLPAGLKGKYGDFGIGTSADLKPFRVMIAAVIGGTASVISGGKFANGAITGAYTQLFNAEKATSKVEDAILLFMKNTGISRDGVNALIQLGDSINKLAEGAQNATNFKVMVTSMNINELKSLSMALGVSKNTISMGLQYQNGDLLKIELQRLYTHSHIRETLGNVVSAVKSAQTAIYIDPMLRIVPKWISIPYQASQYPPGE
jgi:RHS repeat-associated protein